MSPLEIGITGVIGLFFLMALGMPIGVAMGLVGIVGLSCIANVGAALNQLAMTAFSFISYSFAVVPFFMLMGEFASVSGLTTGAFNGVHKWVGHRRGGLAIATIGGCAGFAAVCGSSIATAVTMGSVALPEMRNHKYAPSLATGCVAAGGTLGILIPPSNAFILYGIITEQSIAELFLAGVFPGILLALLFMLTIYILTKLDPSVAPAGPVTRWREKLAASKDIWGIVVLFLVVIGGMYLGVFNPTEAAAVGAFCTFLILLGKRRVTKKNMIDSFVNTLRITGMILVIVIGATVFGYFMTASGVAAELADFLVELPVPRLVIMIMMLALYLILGCIMDAFAMIVVTMPILFPVVVKLGIDPIWFGVLAVIMMEMGMITPPVGMNVFVIGGLVRDVPMYTVFRGALPFVLAMAVCIAIVIAFPQIALFLPHAMK